MAEEVTRIFYWIATGNNLIQIIHGLITHLRRLFHFVCLFVHIVSLTSGNLILDRTSLEGWFSSSKEHRFVISWCSNENPVAFFHVLWPRLEEILNLLFLRILHSSMYSPVLLVMKVDDSLNYHAYWNTNFHAQSSTIMDHHVVWTSSNTFLNPWKGKFVKQSRAWEKQREYLENV